MKTAFPGERITERIMKLITESTGFTDTDAVNPVLFCKRRKRDGKSGLKL